MKEKVVRFTAGALATVLAAGTIGAVIPVVAQAAPATQSQTVHASVDSVYTVTIPSMTIPLDGKTKSAEYTVSTVFDIASDQTLCVTPAESFAMRDVSGGEKDDVTASVTQTKTEWHWNESGTSTTGVITAEGLTSGEWEGSLAFTTVLGSAALKAGLFTSGGTTIAAWNDLRASGVFVVDGEGKLTSSAENYAQFVEDNSLTEATDCKLVVPIGVKTVGDSAFADMDVLGEVVLQRGVTTVESKAFGCCTNLADITIPETVTSISRFAFAGSDNADVTPWLAERLASSNLTVVGDSVLIICGADAGSNVVIPDGTKAIATDAFSNRGASLTSVTIPEGVTSIGSQAFANCSSLTSITIPESVTSMEAYVFDGCTGLRTVVTPNIYNTIPAHAVLGMFTAPNITSLTIRGGETTMDNMAYAYLRGLTEVTIPEGVTSVGKQAFYQCEALESATFSSTVTSIGFMVFGYCDALENVTLNEGLKSIGEQAFYMCSSLTSITLPSTLETIGDYAFFKTGLTSIALPNSVTTIGEGAFSNCNSLQTVTLSTGLKVIPSDAFNSLPAASVTIPEGVTTIKAQAFGGAYCTSITIPSTITTIGDNAFCIRNAVTCAVTYKGTTYTGDATGLAAALQSNGVTVTGALGFLDAE